MALGLEGGDHGVQGPGACLYVPPKKWFEDDLLAGQSLGGVGGVAREAEELVGLCTAEEQGGKPPFAVGGAPDADEGAAVAPHAHLLKGGLGKAGVVCCSRCTEH